MKQYLGILKRDNSGLYLQAKGKNYRVILQRMPVDMMEKNVIVTGEIETDESDGNDTILAQGVRLDGVHHQSEI